MLVFYPMWSGRSNAFVSESCLQKMFKSLILDSRMPQVSWNSIINTPVTCSERVYASDKDMVYSEGPSELHFLGTSIYQATWGFSLRAPNRLPCYVFTFLTSHKGNRWMLVRMQDSFVCQTESSSPSLCLLVDLLKFRDFPRGLWKSGSLVSKLDSPCLMENIYSIPFFKSGNSQ